MRRKIMMITLAVVALAAAGFVLRTLWLTGYFRSIEPHFAGRCRLVEGPIGPEDLTIHPKTGVAYISASDRRAKMAGQPVPGAIFAYDLNSHEARAVNLTPEADISFQPHGLSLWIGEDGREALYVINHPPHDNGPPSHTIEVFDFQDGRLVHRASLTDPLLIMPNDIVAVGFDRFYFTNTHQYPPGIMQTLETYLQFSGAKVIYYGDGRFRPAIEDLVFPNGINVSPDGRTVYVVTVTNRSILVYDRDPDTEALTPHEEIFIGTGGDNVEVDADGNLWIGSHPKLLAFVAHAEDPTKLAPGQVIRVSPDPKGGYRVDEVYLNAGDEIAGTSVAARRGQRLLIGQVFGNGILDCIMDSP